MDIEPILETLEEDNPHEGVRRARELLEDDSLPEDQYSELSYGLATGLFKIGSYHEALDWIEETESDRRWMLEGFCWMNLQNPSRARESFLKSAEELDGHRPESLLLGAQALAQSGDLDEALDELKRLDERDIDGRVGAEIKLNIGLILEEQQAFDGARESFESVLDRPGEFFEDEALFHLAVTHEELGQIEAALEHLNRLDERVEEDSELSEALSRAKNRLTREEKDRSEKLRQYDR